MPFSGKESQLAVTIICEEDVIPNWSIGKYREKLIVALRTAGIEPNVVTPSYSRSGAKVGGLISRVVFLFSRIPKPQGRVIHCLGTPVPKNVDVVTIADFSWRYRRSRSRVAKLSSSIFDKWSIRKARFIVVFTEESKREIRRFYGESIVAKTVVIPIPFDVPEMISADKPSPVKLLWVGTTRPDKRLGLFLEVASHLPFQSVVKLPEGQNYNSSVPGQINILSSDLSEEELRDLYLSSACIVSTSSPHAEGFHMPIVEAYIHGTKVVVPRFPPYTDLFGHSASGVYYYDSDSELSDTIKRAVSGPSFVPNANLLRALSFREVGDHYKRLYSRVLAKP